MFRETFTKLILCTVAGIALCCAEQQSVKSSPELDSIVHSFSRECAMHGVSPDFSREGLQVGFGSVEARAGSCKPNAYPKIVNIDSTTWKHLPPSFKEMLVYHELAHCLLNRSHNNEVFGFGACKSWMRENDSICMVNSLNPGWRKYYVDELFNPTVSFPEGYRDDIKINNNNDPDTVAGVISYSGTKRLSFDSLFFERANWEIKIAISKPATTSGGISIAINEYTIHAASYSALGPINEFNRWIQIDQYKLQTSKNIVSWDSLSAMKDRVEISLIRENNAIYVYFERELKLYMPVRNIRLTGFIIREETNPSLKVYRRK